MLTDEGNWAPKRAFETRAFSLNVPLYITGLQLYIKMSSTSNVY